MVSFLLIITYLCVCGIYDSSLLLKPIECSDQIKLYLINLNSDMYIFVYTSVYVYVMSCIFHHLNIKNFLIASFIKHVWYNCFWTEGEAF